MLFYKVKLIDFDDCLDVGCKIKGETCKDFQPLTGIAISGDI